MSDKIDFGGEPWRALPRSTLRDPTLSPKALGGLVTLLSHEEGWVRSAIGTLQREKLCGREAAQSIMRELVDRGYASRELHRSENGQLRTAYTVYAVRQVQAPEVSGSRQTENPSTVEPSTGAPSAVVEAPDVEAPEVEPKALAAIAAPTLNQQANALAKAYYEAQPLSNFPAVAGICRKALKAGHSDWDIAAALQRLVDEGRGVTTETLRVELEGLPERKSRVPDRGAEILREAYEEAQRAGA